MWTRLYSKTSRMRKTESLNTYTAFKYLVDNTSLPLENLRLVKCIIKLQENFFFQSDGSIFHLKNLTLTCASGQYLLFVLVRSQKLIPVIEYKFLNLQRKHRRGNIGNLDVNKSKHLDFLPTDKKGKWFTADVNPKLIHYHSHCAQ